MNDIVVTKAYTTYIAKAPLYYVRSGYVRLNVGYLRSYGSEGFNWSANPDASGEQSYALGLSLSMLLPAFSAGRWFGYPLR